MDANEPNADITHRRALLAGLGGLAAGTLFTSSARAGELTPPPGPVGPTMKRLDEIEPRIPIGRDTTPGDAFSIHRILESGSYYLTGDVIGEPDKNGISVANSAQEVVIDLNGFTVRGVSRSNAGIIVSGNNPRAMIRNGQIRGWGGRGVSAASLLLEDLRVEDNQLGGARGGGGSGLVPSTVRRCIFINNNGYGLSVGVGSIVESVLSQGSQPAPTIDAAGDGIIVQADSIVENCIVRDNWGAGLRGVDGFIARGVRATKNRKNGFDAGVEGFGTVPIGGSRAIVDRCTADENEEHGFALGPASVITSCFALDNGGIGISAGPLQGAETGGSHVTDSTASRNGRNGIRAGVYATIARCTAMSNGHESENPTWTGILAGVGSRITDCTAAGNNGSGIGTAYNTNISGCNSLFNTGTGISVSFRCIISNCTTRGNLNGISFGSLQNGFCTISGNNCSEATEAGIRGVGSGSQIVENNCTSNETGILVVFPGSGNFIARNVCRGNTTNWDIVQDNKCLVINGTNAPAINGNSGGTSPGSTNPNANYTY